MRLDEHASAAVLPLIWRLSGRPYDAMARELRANESLDPDQLRDLQFGKLSALLHHCYDNVPYYRAMFERLDAHPSDIRSLDDYAALPTLDKSIQREEAHALRAATYPPGQLMAVKTGGSTGVPTTVWQDRRYYDWGWSTFQRNLRWAGYRPGERQAWFTVPAHPSLKRRVRLALERKLHVGVAFQSEQAMATWAEALLAYQPTFIFGYASIVAALATYLMARGLRVESVRRVMTTSETLFPSQRQRIATAFGAQVFNQFGATETYAIASECTHGGMHVNSDVNLVEHVPVERAGGTAFEVVVTPLNAYGVPLLRFRSGDLAGPASGRCACGLPFPMMRMPEGRADDVITFPDGTVISAMLLERMAGDIEGLAQCQFRQSGPDELELLYVPDARLCDRTLELLRDAQRRFTQESAVRLSLRQVTAEQLETTYAGKRRSLVRLGD